MINHERIWLEPQCCADPYVGRQWCAPGPGDPCEEGNSWTEYVRADTISALRAENERLQCELRLAISARDYANDMFDKGRAENERLREALRFLFAETKWKPIDKDNMEFEGRVSCYQLDKARAALKGNREQAAKDKVE